MHCFKPSWAPQRILPNMLSTASDATQFISNSLGLSWLFSTDGKMHEGDSQEQFQTRKGSFAPLDVTGFSRYEVLISFQTHKGSFAPLDGTPSSIACGAC
jgi:hypothetical protein